MISYKMSNSVSPASRIPESQNPLVLDTLADTSVCTSSHFRSRLMGPSFYSSSGYTLRSYLQFKLHLRMEIYKTLVKIQGMDGNRISKKMHTKPLNSPWSFFHIFKSKDHIIFVNFGSVFG